MSTELSLWHFTTIPQQTFCTGLKLHNLSCNLFTCKQVWFFVVLNITCKNVAGTTSKLLGTVNVLSLRSACWFKHTFTLRSLVFLNPLKISKYIIYLSMFAIFLRRFHHRTKLFIQKQLQWYLHLFLIFCFTSSFFNTPLSL